MILRIKNMIPILFKYQYYLSALNDQNNKNNQKL